MDKYTVVAIDWSGRSDGFTLEPEGTGKCQPGCTATLPLEVTGRVVLEQTGQAQTASATPVPLLLDRPRLSVLKGFGDNEAAAVAWIEANRRYFDFTQLLERESN